MAQQFNLSAQLIIQNPTGQNIRDIRKQVEKQLSNIGFDINTSKLNKARSSVQGLTKDMEDGGKTAKTFSELVALKGESFAAYAVASAAIIKLSNAISRATTDALYFEKEVAKIAQTINKSVSDANKYSDAMLRISKSTGLVQSRVAETVRVLAQAGLSIDVALQAAEKLAKTTLLSTFNDLSSTTEALIALMASFGLSVDQAGEAIDAINVVSKRFAVESDDIVDAIKRTGGAFKSAGGNINELIALFTSVRSSSRESADTIATAFRTIFGRLQRPKTIEYFRELGIELTDLNGNFIGGYKAVQRISEGLNRLGIAAGSVKFAEIVEEVGGIRQISKVVPLLTNFKNAQVALAAANEGVAESDADVIKAKETLAQKIAELQANFSALITEVTQTSGFKEMANIFITLANGAIEFARSIKDLLPLLAALGAFKLGQGVASVFKQGIGKNIATPGAVSGFARGGLVPGSGNGDTVPAMLTPGEFVIRKSAVQAFGADQLANINKYKNGTDKKGVKPINGPIVIDTPIGQLFPTGSPSGPEQVSATVDGKEYIANVSNHVLTKSQGFAKVADNLSEVAASSMIKYIKSRNESLKESSNIKESQGFQNAIKGFGFEAYVDMLSGAIRSDSENSPFDYPPGSFTSNAELAAMIDAPVGANEYIDATTNTNRRKSRIVTKAARQFFGTSKQQKKASGGSISGYGTDTVPALLTPGEFVINKKSAEAFGYTNLNKINRYAKGGPVEVQRFADGGSVGGFGNTALLSQLTDVGLRFALLNTTVGVSTSAFGTLGQAVLNGKQAIDEMKASTKQYERLQQTISDKIAKSENAIESFKDGILVANTALSNIQDTAQQRGVATRSVAVLSASGAAATAAKVQQAGPSGQFGSGVTPLTPEQTKKFQARIDTIIKQYADNSDVITELNNLQSKFSSELDVAYVAIKEFTKTYDDAIEKTKSAAEANARAIASTDAADAVNAQQIQNLASGNAGPVDPQLAAQLNAEIVNLKAGYSHNADIMNDLAALEASYSSDVRDQATAIKTYIASINQSKKASSDITPEEAKRIKAIRDHINVLQEGVKSEEEVIKVNRQRANRLKATQSTIGSRLKGAIKSIGFDQIARTASQVILFAVSAYASSLTRAARLHEEAANKASQAGNVEESIEEKRKQLNIESTAERVQRYTAIGAGIGNVAGMLIGAGVFGGTTGGIGTPGGVVLGGSIGTAVGSLAGSLLGLVPTMDDFTDMLGLTAKAAEKEAAIREFTVQAHKNALDKELRDRQNQIDKLKGVDPAKTQEILTKTLEEGLLSQAVKDDEEQREKLIPYFNQLEDRLIQLSKEGKNVEKSFEDLRKDNPKLVDDLFRFGEALGFPKERLENHGKAIDASSANIIRENQIRAYGISILQDSIAAQERFVNSIIEAEASISKQRGVLAARDVRLQSLGGSVSGPSVGSFGVSISDTSKRNSEAFQNTLQAIFDVGSDAVKEQINKFNQVSNVLDTFRDELLEVSQITDSSERSRAVEGRLKKSLSGLSGDEVEQVISKIQDVFKASIDDKNLKRLSTEGFQSLFDDIEKTLIADLPKNIDESKEKLKESLQLHAEILAKDAEIQSKITSSRAEAFDAITSISRAFRSQDNPITPDEAQRTQRQRANLLRGSTAFSFTGDNAADAKKAASRITSLTLELEKLQKKVTSTGIQTEEDIKQAAKLATEINNLNSVFNELTNTSGLLEAAQDQFRRKEEARLLKKDLGTELAFGTRESRLKTFQLASASNFLVAGGSIDQIPEDMRSELQSFLARFAKLPAFDKGKTGQEILDEQTRKYLERAGLSQAEIEKIMLETKPIEEQQLIELVKIKQALQENLQGSVSVQTKANGGLIYASNGASIFKPKGTDTVPAMLTPGEFVVNKKAMSNKHNAAIVEGINSGKGVSYLASGGYGAYKPRSKREALEMLQQRRDAKRGLTAEQQAEAIRQREARYAQIDQSRGVQTYQSGGSTYYYNNKPQNRREALLRVQERKNSKNLPIPQADREAILADKRAKVEEEAKRRKEFRRRGDTVRRIREDDAFRASGGEQIKASPESRAALIYNANMEKIKSEVKESYNSRQGIMPIDYYSRDIESYKTYERGINLPKIETEPVFDRLPLILTDESSLNEFNRNVSKATFRLFNDDLIISNIQSLRGKGNYDDNHIDSMIKAVVSSREMLSRISQKGDAATLDDLEKSQAINALIDRIDLNIRHAGSFSEPNRSYRFDPSENYDVKNDLLPPQFERDRRAALAKSIQKMREKLPIRDTATFDTSSIVPYMFYNNTMERHHGAINNLRPSVLRERFKREFGFATGGIVPGIGNKDTVSAKLTPGEFVMKKSSVDKIGANNLNKMNQTGSLPSTDGDLSKAISSFNLGVETFGKFANTLSSSLMAFVQTPKTFEMTIAPLTVSVNINGAEALSSMMEPLRNLVMETINANMNKIVYQVTKSQKSGNSGTRF